MKEKYLVRMSKGVSILCSPFLMPVMGLLILFIFSYLSILPWEAKLYIFIIFLLFTVMLPLTLIRMYCRFKGCNMKELKDKGMRLVPFIICILSYVAGYYCLIINHIPYEIRCIIISAIVIQILCAIINRWWHICVHSAAIGGVLGAIIAFSRIFSFNPVWWMCIVILIGGLVGTSRMVLKKHTLEQVVAGFLLGTFCTIIVV
ncbi:MAG: phosphatase PAP2 family protein [Prevotella sp.]|nr:phosphatase PAP2 family protein [Prevotella sp.]